MIYTSYFAKVKDLPKSIVPIAICGKSPDWWDGLEYKTLAPKWEFFKLWKYENRDNEYYIINYYNKVLCRLRPDGVVQQLQELAGGKDKDIALICYEKPGEFCHRNIVREWLKEFGYEVEEYVFLKDALKKLLEEPPMYVCETLMAFDKPGEAE